jgi:hypothetical protein
MENAERAADFQAIDKSLAEIHRQVKYLDGIRTWSGTIKSSHIYSLVRFAGLGEGRKTSRICSLAPLAGRGSG